MAFPLLQVAGLLACLPAGVLIACGGLAMKRLIWLTLVLTTLATTARAELTFAELAHGYEKSGQGRVEPYDNYLMGLYEGINAANLASYMQTRKRLLCKPDNLDLNPRDLFRMIKETHDVFDKSNEIPVSYLLFIGLRQTFPCL